MIRLQGFGIIKLGQVQNPRWPPLLKIAKTTKQTSSQKPLGIISCQFAWRVRGTLVLKIVKIKKSTAELSHSNILSVYKSNFAQVPISQDNTNVFGSDLITMVPEWNHFIFMQIDNPRLLPGAATKNSINTKMTISQDALVEIYPTLCQNVSCRKPFFFYWNGTILHLCKLTIQVGHRAVNKTSINMKMTISQEPSV